nr:hypothetical protein [uncultured Shinella sp.]
MVEADTSWLLGNLFNNQCEAGIHLESLLQAQNMLEDTVVKSTTQCVSRSELPRSFLESCWPAYAAEWAAFIAAHPCQ